MDGYSCKNHEFIDPMPETEIVPAREIYTVSRLNREVAELLAGTFPLIWLEAEISNFSQPRSGHLYFSLKDSEAQVRAAMFRNRNLYITFRPKDGMLVRVRARIALYEPRGDYQLIIEHMEEAGDGALRRAFDILKQKLLTEGLFEADRKKPLPAFPKRIGIITSATGAALRDVLNVLKRRYPLAPVLIYPVQVQGTAAPDDIAATLTLATKRNDCDVLLLVRGGGSLEDLQAFNDERVARVIATCTIPVVSGIGHETDFTIADFVADLRAPTPSVAAELATPDIAALRCQNTQLASQLIRSIEIRLHKIRQSFDSLLQRLQHRHPQQRLNQQSQRLDELELRLRYAINRKLQNTASPLNRLEARLLAIHPQIRIGQLITLNRQLSQRLGHSIKNILLGKRATLNGVLRNLETVSPLATLARGYAIVTPENSRTPVRSSGEVTKGEKLDLRLNKGQLKVTVE
jgi:exodeoxyribonuclease VII large subunit